MTLLKLQASTQVIVLQFALFLNIDVAEEEVQAAINAAQRFVAVQPALSACL